MGEPSDVPTAGNPVDDFLVRWAHVRGMTREFLESAPDALLDFVPAPGFVPVRDQASHLVEVQGVYQEVLAEGALDMSHKARYTPAGTEPDVILAALAQMDADLERQLDRLRPDAGSWTVDWFGNEGSRASARSSSNTRLCITGSGLARAPRGISRADWMASELGAVRGTPEHSSTRVSTLRARVARRSGTGDDPAMKY